MVDGKNTPFGNDNKHKTNDAVASNKGGTNRSDR